MQTQNRFFDDISRLATGALGTVQNLRQEVEGLVRQAVERLVGELKLVPREEFEAVKAIAVAAREENEMLARRLAVLEAQIGGDEKPGA